MACCHLRVMVVKAARKEEGWGAGGGVLQMGLSEPGRGRVGCARGKLRVSA